MTKAYGYLRVSGRGQVEGDGYERQRLAIEQHCGVTGVEVAGWYREEGVSGETEWGDRPAWGEMLDRIVGNGVRAIAIERLDRLARDLMVQEHIIADLRKRGIELISTAEPDLGSDEPSRVMMRQIMGAVAQYDKCMIVRKLKGARQRAKQRDGRCEGRKPYGHYPGEAEILEEMRGISVNVSGNVGGNVAEVTRVLNERGRVGRGGKPWHPYVVGRILKGAKLGE